jgi:hypothetical protein
MYGDSIYPIRQHLRSRNAALVGPLLLVDKAMSACRVSIENNFGFADGLFPYLCHEKNVKLMSGMPVADILFCKALFTNMYTCLYGNLNSARFECQAPSLESYMA